MRVSSDLRPVGRKRKNGWYVPDAFHEFQIGDRCSCSQIKNLQRPAGGLGMVLGGWPLMS